MVEKWIFHTHYTWLALLNLCSPERITKSPWWTGSEIPTLDTLYICLGYQCIHKVSIFLGRTNGM